MKLIIEDEEGRRTTVPFVQDEISIGRHEGNAIRLPDRNVSRRHALLIKQNGHVLVEDLNSSNGVRVNGERISGRTSVAEGDLIQIGDFDLTLGRDSGIETSDGRGTTLPEHFSPGVVAAAVASPPAKDTNPQRRTPTVVIQPPAIPAAAPGLLRPVDRPRLVLLNSQEVGREIVVERAEVIVGRAPEESDIVIDHPSLGRGHARLKRDAEGVWHLSGLGMAGGVKVNGARHTETSLAPGDVLQLGLVRMRFVSPGERFSLEGWRAEQRRKERPYQIVLAVLALIVVGLLAYVVINRPKGRVNPAVAAPEASAEPEEAIDPPTPPPAAHVVPTPAPPEPAAPPSEPHAKGSKSRKHRGSGEELAETQGTPIPTASADARARGEALYEQGVALIGDADYVGALGRLSQALDLDPSLADAHKAMGVCYAHLQEADKGAYHYEQYLKLNPHAEDAAQVRRMLADYYKTRPATQE